DVGRSRHRALYGWHFEVTPTAPSVVPGRVHFSIGAGAAVSASAESAITHDDADLIESLGNRIPALCEAARGRCTAIVRELLYDAPLQFREEMRALPPPRASRRTAHAAAVSRGP